MKIASENLLQHVSDTELVGQNINWLSTLRQKAQEHFANVGLPGIRDEQWRYTNLRALKNHTYTLESAVKNQTLNEELAKQLDLTDNDRLVFIDGFIADQYTKIENLDHQITFTNLASVLKTSPDLIEEYFGSTLPSEQHGFTALNSAYCQDGYVLNIPKECTQISKNLERLIHAISLLLTNIHKAKLSNDILALMDQFI